MNWIKPALLALLLGTSQSFAQGTLVYDQQSVPGDFGAGGLATIQTNSPIGQSFTPGLNSIGFIRLSVSDINPGNSLGATLFIRVRANAIDGVILGTSDSVSLPNGFGY